MQIRSFRASDEAAVIALWRACDLLRPWNDPRRDIRRKLCVQPELFLVGVLGDAIVAAVMAGYDGHRGWMNYLAVDPEHRGQGLGRALVGEVEHLLAQLGCPKVNIQVRADNARAVGFYRRLGYAVDEVVSLGRRLERDDGD